MPRSVVQIPVAHGVEEGIVAEKQSRAQRPATPGRFLVHGVQQGGGSPTARGGDQVGTVAGQRQRRGRIEDADGGAAHCPPATVAAWTAFSENASSKARSSDWNSSTSTMRPSTMR